MVKEKQRDTRRAPSKKPRDESSINPPDEGDWMVVKKQKITILIPPLPTKAIPTIPSADEGQLQENPRITNSQSPKSVHKTRKSKSLSPKRDVHPPLVVHPCAEPNLTLQKPSSLAHRIVSDNSPLYGEGKGSKGIMIFTDGSVFLDRRMRALYLDRKLKKAGGLENWLVSVGLSRFVKVFRTRSVSKFQLANLTMEKLKDMGTDAVGPRRKLMHAIDCLCEPHCFQHV